MQAIIGISKSFKRQLVLDSRFSNLSLVSRGHSSPPWSYSIRTSAWWRLNEIIDPVIFMDWYENWSQIFYCDCLWNLYFPPVFSLQFILTQWSRRFSWYSLLLKESSLLSPVIAKYRSMLSNSSFVSVWLFLMYSSYPQCKVFWN